MPSKNKIVIAAAGSGKTTDIVNRIASIDPKERVIVTTFTLSNISEIKNKFENELGHIPSNIYIVPWFTFILHELVRPYQNFFYRPQRTQALNLVNGRSDTYAPKADKGRYYFGNSPNVYSDKISELAIECNKASNGKVLARLEELAVHLFIDEVQDLAGYDLELLILFIQSNINLTMVGDYRQATLSTNQSQKNKKYRGSGIINLFQEWSDKNLCELTFKTNSYRCHESLCKFSDLVFPDSPKTDSQNKVVTGHEGIIFVRKVDVPEYIETYKPQILRHSRANKCLGYPAINFGISKGRTYERNLIFPTAKIIEYLKTGDVSKLSDKESFYVSVTRARQSVAFVYDDETAIQDIQIFKPKD